VTSIDPERPHVIEVRRGRRGTGTWRGAPGEDFHSTTGEPGGLWRDRGFPPQRLVGVGMATQGFDRAVPFEREAGADDPRAAWIFDGVPDGPIGDSGLVMGGAAGLEVDRFDHALGTPPHALLLATARGFSDSYQHVVEEVESSDSRQGGTVSPFVRGDMTFFELPDGGAVFSASSISWCGSLSHNGYDNAVSRITENVLRRFAAPGPVGGALVRGEAVAR
jgi:N,N-dimethylformamidase